MSAVSVMHVAPRSSSAFCNHWFLMRRLGTHTRKTPSPAPVNTSLPARSSRCAGGLGGLRRVLQSKEPAQVEGDPGRRDEPRRPLAQIRLPGARRTRQNSLDVFWLKDKSLTDLDNLPEPDELAEEIIENLEAGPNSFRQVLLGLSKPAHEQLRPTISPCLRASVVHLLRDLPNLGSSQAKLASALEATINTKSL